MRAAQPRAPNAGTQLGGVVFALGQEGGSGGRGGPHGARGSGHQMKGWNHSSPAARRSGGGPGRSGRRGPEAPGEAGRAASRLRASFSLVTPFPALRRVESSRLCRSGNCFGAGPGGRGRQKGGRPSSAPSAQHHRAPCTPTDPTGESPARETSEVFYTGVGWGTPQRRPHGLPWRRSGPRLTHPVLRGALSGNVTKKAGLRVKAISQPAFKAVATGLVLSGHRPCPVPHMP